MLLEVKTRVSGGVAILDVSGRATVGPEADALRNQILKAFKDKSHFLLLNCEGLAYMDSAAAGAMVYAHASIARQGGELKLLRPHKRLLNILTISRLDRVFEILDDESTAVASFSRMQPSKL